MASGHFDWQQVRARPNLLIGIVLAVTGVVVMLGFGLAYLAFTWRPHHAGGGSEPVHVPVAAGAPVAAAPVPSVEDEVKALSEGLRLQPLDADQARLFNAGIPVSTEPNPPMRPFVLPAGLDPVMRARATDCLTAAIYYEAGHEPLDGRRAVAQVVLNRVRHFAYPKSVCEVVFQNSAPTIGCQFTFACDGSLARPPEPVLWKAARAVAEQALAGKVVKPVGRATHYHADYVAPYWEPYLVKVAVIGQHIFYRGEGAWSADAAFLGAYDGVEPDVPAMAGLWSEAALPPPVVDPGTVDARADAPIVLPAIAPPPPSLPPARAADPIPDAPATTPGSPAVPPGPPDRRDGKVRSTVPVARRIPT